MRIGIITGEYPPRQGGVGAYTQILARSLADKNDIFILCRKDAEETHPSITISNTIQNWSLTSLWQIRRWAKRNRLDIVNLQFETAAYNMSPWVHLLPKALGNTPFVTTFHDLLVPYLFPKAGNLRNQVVNFLAEKSDGIITTNQEDLRRLRHVRNRTLIPIGSNISTLLPENYRRNEWRSKANASNDDFLIGHFGFMNRTKGIETLLEDMALIIENYDYPFKLVMIGGRTGESDPENVTYADQVDRYIEALGLSDRVYWSGYVTDAEVSAFLHACDVVALPFKDGASYRRGSLMAAISHGCAIITTEPQVNIPLFIDGENMMLARPHILDEDIPPYRHISQELLLLYRNPQLRKKISAGARELTKHFDWTCIVDDYLRFFEHVIGDKN